MLNPVVSHVTTSANVTSGHHAALITPGTRAYRNVCLAMFLAGFASFSLIYCVQPLLPDFVRYFQISPVKSSLALSLTTGMLALAIFSSAIFSQLLGRRWLMFGSMVIAALMNLLSAHGGQWELLLLFRAIEGFVLGGVPSVAMAYLGEEIEPSYLGKAMGLYIAGNAFGAMMGRVGMGLLAAFSNWQTAMDFLALLSLVSAILFILLMPPSKHFVAKRQLNIPWHIDAWKRHLNNGALMRLYGIGFLLTSIFVTVFNYSTFRLTQAPYFFNQTQICMIFLLFGFGMISSSLAGGLCDRYDRSLLVGVGFILMLMGLVLTLFQACIAIMSGIALITTGFFVSHSVASSTIGIIARENRAHASSLYLLFYYLGSSITGSASGWLWQGGGWNAVVGLGVVLALCGLLLAWILSRR